MPPWPHWPLVYHCCALIIAALQAASLDYYLVFLNYNPKNEKASLWWTAWAIADVLVISLIMANFFLSRRYLATYGKRERNVEQRHQETTRTRRSKKRRTKDHLGILPYAWIVWLFYSPFLIGKIIAVFQTYGSGLVEKDVFGINLLEFTIAGTIVYTTQCHRLI